VRGNTLGVSAASSSPLRAGSGRDTTPYERFVASVVNAQLRAWLVPTCTRVLDISHPDPARGTGGVSAMIARGGADVIRVVSPDAWSTHEAARRDGPVSLPHSPRIRNVVGDARSLDWFRSDCMDAVVAEGSTLSSCLVTETTVEQAARLLRPGGRLLLSVDSLLYGLARLAEQHRWRELADANTADVVLIPNEGPSGSGAVTRCFGPEELRELVEAAGFDVDWVRPRTVIPPDVVSHAIEQDPGVLAELVASELSLADERQGESLGMYLSLSATLRRG
jgi:SAM-dependent methyltransferase